MKYLTCVGRRHVPKSKIEESIQDFLLQNDRKLLDADSVEAFKESIIAHINFICQENSRCKPRLTFWFRFGDLHRDFGLSGINSIIFSLYEIDGVAMLNLNKQEKNE